MCGALFAMYAFYFNVWVDVIDLCGEVVDVVCGTLLMHSHGLWSLSLCEKWMYMCWPKYSGLYLSCRRKALTSSFFSGVSTMPPFLSCLMVNVFPGNASFSLAFCKISTTPGTNFTDGKFNTKRRFLFPHFIFNRTVYFRFPG